MRPPFTLKTIACGFLAAASLFATLGHADVPRTFSLYSLEETFVYERTSLSGGDIGSNGRVTVGGQSRVTGDVYAGGDVSLGNQAYVNGDVSAQGTINKGHGVTITGTENQGVSLPTHTIPSRSVSPGSTPVDVPNDGAQLLTPGAYGDVVVRDRATLTLNGGTYAFRSLQMWNETVLELDFADGEQVVINVENDLTFKDRVVFVYSDNVDFSNVDIYSGSGNVIKLGNDMQFAGYLSAPFATVEISDRVRFEGAVYGKVVKVMYDVENETQLPTGEGVMTVVKTVNDNNDGTYTVEFGYINDGTTTVVIPIGANNYMTGLAGGSMDGGQVTVFHPGQVNTAFSVNTDGSPVEWVLYGNDPDHVKVRIADSSNVVHDTLPITPRVNYVRDNCDGTCTAVFGYYSPNDVVARVDIGADNAIIGTGSIDEGQPFLFERGTHDSAFSVSFSGTSIEWLLQGQRLRATRTDALLSCLPIQPFLTSVVENHDGLTKAVFGYTNPNELPVERQITASNNFVCCLTDSNAGQPVVFDTGTVEQAFLIIFDESQIAWTLDGTTVTAERNNAVDRDFGMWTGVAIGTGVDGNYSIAGEKLIAAATGDGGDAYNDKRYFVHHTTDTDFDIMLKYQHPADSAPSKAGLMLRSGTTDIAALFALSVKEDGTIVLEYRANDGGAITETTVGTVSSTPWLRISRAGSVCEAFVANSADTWSSAGAENTSLAGSLDFGLAVEGQSAYDVDAVFSNLMVEFADNNGNGIPDVAETIIGGSLQGVPQRSRWANEGVAAGVTDDYSAVAGYEHCAAVRSTYTHAEADGAILPVNQLVDTAFVPIPANEGLKTFADGGKLHKITGTVKEYERVMQAFPLSAHLRGVPQNLLRLDHFNNATGSWEEVGVSGVANDAAYALVTSYSYYRLSSDYVIKKVATGDELRAALAVAADSASESIKYAIVCEGSEEGVYYRGGDGLIAFTVPDYVYLLGGVPDVDSVTNDKPFKSDPSKYKSILTVREQTGPDLVNQVVLDMRVDSLVAGEQKNMHSTIEGFTVEGGDNLGSEWSAGGLRIAGIGGHIAYVDVRNCTFRNNRGTTAGAINVSNARFINIESCRFEENVQTPSQAPEVPKDGNTYGASAVLLTLGGDCHSEVNIRNCVFYKNRAEGPKYAGTVTVFGDYGSDGDENAVPDPGAESSITMGIVQNCTFTKNTVTSLDTTCAGALVRKNTAFDTMSVQNCVIWENTADGANPRNVNAYLTGTHITYSDIGDTAIQESTDIPNGITFNINTDPSFIDTSNIDGLRLGYASVCVNKGMDLLDEVKTDIHGIRRNIGLYDMGAYENNIKILPVGDGNTVGWGGACYRAYLKKLILDSSNFEVDFVGLQETGPGRPWEVAAGMAEIIAEQLWQSEEINDIQHEGIYDRSLLSLIGPGSTQSQINSYIAESLHLEENAFDVLLLMVGTNSLSQENLNYSSVLDSIKAAVTGINNWITDNGGNQKFLLSTVPAQKIVSQGSFIDDNITALNDSLLANIEIIAKTDAVAEMYDPAYDIGGGAEVALKNYFHSSDNRYFKPEGYNIMAYEWWDKIRSILP